MYSDQEQEPDNIKYRTSSIPWSRAANSELHHSYNGGKHQAGKRSCPGDFRCLRVLQSCYPSLALHPVAILRFSHTSPVSRPVLLIRASVLQYSKDHHCLATQSPRRVFSLTHAMMPMMLLTALPIYSHCTVHPTD